MADQPTSGGASAQVEEPTQPTSPATSASSPETSSQANTASAAQSAADKQRMVSEENFRRMQGQLTQQLRQRDEQINQLTQRIDELAVRDMPDDQRQAYQARQYINQLQAQLRDAQAAANQFQIDQRANAELMEIAEEFGGSFTEYRRMWESGKQPNEIWRTAAKMFKEQQVLAEKQAAKAEKSETNRVDLGSGKALTTLSEWEAAVAEAEKQKDTFAYTRLMRQRPTQ